MDSGIILNLITFRDLVNNTDKKIRGMSHLPSSPRKFFRVLTHMWYIADLFSDFKAYRNA